MPVPLECGVEVDADILSEVSCTHQEAVDEGRIVSLRNPEQDGIVTRRVYASVPPKVEYSLTSLGQSSCCLVEDICGWAEANIEKVQAAPEVCDRTPREASVSQGHRADAYVSDRNPRCPKNHKVAERPRLACLQKL